MSGWCGRGDKPRTFKKQPKLFYSDLTFKCDTYDNLRYSTLMGKIVSTHNAAQGKPCLVHINKNELCRISLPDGPQIGHVFLWNANDSKEYFSAETTLLLQGTHITKYSRLWSEEPFVRPMATIVADSIPYKTDEDGAKLHDVLASPCSTNTHSLITGRPINGKSCIIALGLLHIENKSKTPLQGWNIFNCSGFSKETCQYFTKATPSIKGDYIDFIADMDLIVGVVSCNRGTGTLEAEQNKNNLLKCEVFAAL